MTDEPTNFSVENLQPALLDNIGSVAKIGF
jgi:hypothetical protein